MEKKIEVCGALTNIDIPRICLKSHSFLLGMSHRVRKKDFQKISSVVIKTQWTHGDENGSQSQSSRQLTSGHSSFEISSSHRSLSGSQYYLSSDLTKIIVKNNKKWKILSTSNFSDLIGHPSTHDVFMENVGIFLTTGIIFGFYEKV